jgi:type VI secretion system protein ImpL
MKKLLRVAGILLLVALAMLSLALLVGQAGAFSQYLPENSLKLIVVVLFFLTALLTVSIGIFRISAFYRTPLRPAIHNEVAEGVPVKATDYSSLTSYLRQQDGWRWKRRRPWLLVTGSPSLVEQMAPGLTTQGWLCCNDAVLLWGGNITEAGSGQDLPAIRRLRGRRPVDALVHMADDTAADSEALLRALRQMALVLRWRAPLYLLSVATSGGAQPLRQVVPAAVMAVSAFTPETLSAALAGLSDDLAAPAMALVAQDPRQDYLLRLAAQLKLRAIPHLRETVQAISGNGARLSLHGVAFMPLLANAGTGFAYEQQAGKLWRCIAGHSASLAGKPEGVDGRTIACWCLCGLLGLWALGTVTAGISNGRLIARTQTLISTSSAFTGKDRLSALQSQLQALSQQQRSGTPWYRRFGLDISGQLPALLWPVYLREARALIVTPAQQRLSQALANVSDSPQTEYDRLKALLMLTQPARVNDAPAQVFLAGQLQAVLPAVAPEQLSWFAARLPAHPELRATPDDALIAATRARLAVAINGAQAQEQRYQTIIRSAGLNFADIRLSQLAGSDELTGIFTLEGVVPGAYTRDAWVSAIRPAIDRQVKDISEQTTWVLGQQQGALSPDALRRSLTARYFTDYARAWQQALNPIQYRPTRDAGQLALLADSHASPLAALMRQLYYQGLAGSPDEAQKKVNVLLEPVFGGLVAMVGGQQAGRKGITLRQWQADAKRFADRIRGMSSAEDNAQALATSVFKGTQIDNTAAALPGRIREQLGDALAPMGNTLFVAPFERAWRELLQQRMRDMNEQWRQTIVAGWQRRFVGKYPFSQGREEVNLAELAQFINPTSGYINTFIHRHLGGVLAYRNLRWQENDQRMPGLAVSPAFLAALNRLNQAGQVLFAKGFGVAFRLQPESARDVAMTELFIDGVTLKYFNQMPFWQEVRWPGETMAPGASLVWSSVQAGARLYRDFPGQWGFIRLLEQAKVSKEGQNRARLTWAAQDGQMLNYLLEAEADQDPLTVLSLKGFRLPETIFSSGIAATGRPRVRP